MEIILYFRYRNSCMFCLRFSTRGQCVNVGGQNVHAIVNVSPCFGQVCEDTACVRNTEIGQMSVGVCACK